MRKNPSLLPLLLALCLLLSACGEAAVSPEEEAAPVPTSAASPVPTPAEEEGADTSEEAGAEASAEDASPEGPLAEAPVSGEEAAEAAASSGIWTLYQEGDYRFLFVITRDPGTSAPRCYLRLRFPDQGEAHLRVDDLLINGSLLSLDEYSAWGDEENIWELSLGKLISLGALRPEDELRLSCRLYQTVRREDGGGEEVLWEQRCEAVVPAGFSPGFVFLPCLGSLAGEQPLLDDGQLRVLLLGMGTPAGQAGSTLACQLRVENRGSEDLSFQIKGLNVNGAFYDISSSETTLSPGTVSYPYASLYKSELEETGISDIGEIALWLQTGKKNDSKGSWVPVVLSQRSQGSSEPDYEKILYEDRYLRIGYAGISEYSYQGTTTYVWRLAIRNLSRQDLLLSFSSEEEDLSVYFSCKLGAEAWIYDSVYAMVPEGTARPALSLPFSLYTVDRGTLLAADAGPIVLPAD